MKRGPQHGGAFYERRKVGDVDVEIMARHHLRRRMPRGSELTMQLVRGRGLRMVEDEIFEWTILANQRRIGTLHQNPNGTLTIARMSGGQRTSRSTMFSTAVDEIVRSIIKQ